MRFQYMVTGFDEGQKTVDVVFADGGWARIPLCLPFPTSAAELDDIVKAYALSDEQVQAVATTADLSFISGLVGIERDVDRLPSKFGDPPIPPSQNDTIKAQIAALEATQHRAVREHALGDPDAIARLQSIESSIVQLRTQLT